MLSWTNADRSTIEERVEGSHYVQRKPNKSWRLNLEQYSKNVYTTDSEGENGLSNSM